MRVLRSPVTLFLLVGLLTVTGIVIGTGLPRGPGRERRGDGRGSQHRRAGRRLRSSRPGDPAPLVARSPGAVDRFDTRDARASSRTSPIDHVAIIDRTGRDRVRRRRSRASGDSVRARPRASSGSSTQGGTGSRDADPDRRRPAARADDGPRASSETWTRHATRAAAASRCSSRPTSPSTNVADPAAGDLLVVPLDHHRAAAAAHRRRHPDAAASSPASSHAGRKERERLLRSAIDASDAERRRIARDLHDGVVQDLAGTAFSVSALARDPETAPRPAPSLQGAARSLRDGPEVAALAAGRDPPARAARRGPRRRARRPDRAGRGARASRPR